MNKKFTKEEIKKLFTQYGCNRVSGETGDKEFDSAEVQKYWEYFLAGFNQANELNKKIGEGRIAIRYSLYERNQWGIADKQFFTKYERTPNSISDIEIPDFIEIGCHIFRHKDMLDGEKELQELGFEIIDSSKYLLPLLIKNNL